MLLKLDEINVIVSRNEWYFKFSLKRHFPRLRTSPRTPIVSLHIMQFNYLVIGLFILQSEIASPLQDHSSRFGDFPLSLMWRCIDCVHGVRVILFIAEKKWTLNWENSLGRFNFPRRRRPMNLTSLILKRKHR